MASPIILPSDTGIMANAPLAYINGIFDGNRGYATPFMSPGHLVTNNKDIKDLVDTFGFLLFEAMQLPDVWIASAPDIGFIKTVGKAIDRFRMIVSARMLPDGQAAPRGALIAPSQEPFMIFPIPYFNIRNAWARRWAWNGMMALAEAMRHQNNALLMGFDSTLGGLMSMYTELTYKQIAVEMLGLPAPVALLPGQAIPPVPTITEAQYAGYDKTKFSVGQRIDGGASITSQLPIDAVMAIANGIPATQIYTQLQNPPGATANSIAGGGAGTVVAASATASTTPTVPPPPSA